MSQAATVSKKIIPFSAEAGQKLINQVIGVEQNTTGLQQKVTGLEKKVITIEQRLTHIEQDVAVLKYDMVEVKSDVAVLKQTLSDQVITRLDQIIVMMTKRDTEQVAHTAWLQRHDHDITQLQHHVGLVTQG